MTEIDPSANRRKAGLAAAVVLGFSAIASLVGLLIYARTLPKYPSGSLILFTITVLFAFALAAWLARAVWTADARWAGFALLSWAIIKQVMPNLLYPSTLPKAVYLLAMSLAIIAVIRPKKTIA